MNNIELLKKIDEIEDSTSIYLLETLSDTAGFFSSEKKLLFIIRDVSNIGFEGIDTDYLRLQTHIKIHGVKNDQTFEDGYYNIIMYKGDLAESNCDAFVKLCRVYTQKAEDLDFKEFFYSLIALFQLPSEQAYINAVGLYGELKFMQYVKESFGKDISICWHKRGSYSKYDFANENCCMEVKTTTSEERDVLIKHNQIFGNHRCVLVAVNCDRFESGETLEEVVTNMQNDPLFFNGIDFQINLMKELKRISMDDYQNVRFDVLSIKLFDSVDINPFEDIPEYISKLTYRMELTQCDEMKPDSAKELFE